MDTWNTFPIQVEGGLVTNVSEIKHGIEQPGSASYLVNFEPSIQGGFRRINGYTKFDSNVVPSAVSSTQLLGVAFFDGSVIVPREGKVYSSTGSGWTEIATGRTQPNKVRFHIFNFSGTRKLCAVDGSNYPWTWDGSTFTELTATTDIQGARHVVEFKDHLFFSKGNLVTFSAPFDETDYTPANGAGSFRVDNDVTGMIVFRERLFVFTADSIKVLTGNSEADFALTSVSEQVGCLKEDTIQQVSGDVAFLSADGVRMLGATDRIGDFSNLTASSKIQKNMLNFNETYDTYSSVVVREKSQYRVFGSSTSLPQINCGGYLGTQFEPQNSQSFEWAALENIKVYASDSKVYQGEEYIVFIDSDDEYVYRMEQGSDFDGTAIQAAYWTPYISFGDPLRRKTFFKADVFLDAEGPVSGMLSLSLDQGRETKPQPSAVTLSSDGTGAIWGEFNWDAEDWSVGTNETRLQTPLIGSGFTASLQFEFSEASDPFVIDMIFVEFKEEGRL